MRFVVHEQWWQVPFGTATRACWSSVRVFPCRCTPANCWLVFVWFSLVSWLMVRTKNIWDCAGTHGVTNFLLGVYVVMLRPMATM